MAERTRLINQLHDQMLQIDPTYQTESGPLTKERGVLYCRDLTLTTTTGVLQTRLLIVHQLAAQLLRLEEDSATLTAQIRERVHAIQTPLLTVCGVGEVIAARIIGELGSQPRVRSAAAFAALAGVAPVAVSSGGRHGHRLSRGGNRQLHRALHMIALSQRRCDLRAQVYYAKKRAEGKTARAAMRCLKRRLADVLFRALHPHAADTCAPLPGVEAAPAAPGPAAATTP